MPAATSEIARLKRDIADLAAVLRPNAKSPVSAREKLALKSEIDWCMQRLDELRSSLSG